MREKKKLIKKRKKKTVKKRAKKRDEKPTPPIVTCGLCGNEGVELAYVEADEGWELPDHPDYFSRDVGKCCLEYAARRTGLVITVLEEVEFKLRRKGRGATRKELSGDKVREITGKISRLATALDPLKDYEIGGDEDQLLTKWAKKLDVDSLWLEEFAC